MADDFPRGISYAAVMAADAAALETEERHMRIDYRHWINDTLKAAADLPEMDLDSLFCALHDLVPVSGCFDEQEAKDDKLDHLAQAIATRKALDEKARRAREARIH